MENKTRCLGMTRRKTNCKWKTKMCRNYANCAYVHCLYAHSIAELRPILVSANFKSKRCKSFPNCNYFQNCKFYHGLETVHQLNENCRRCFVFMYPDGYVISKICFRTTIQNDMCTCFTNNVILI